ncbi:MAG: ABC transporter ATP-binding protein [Chlorobi bacterium]|nr:ABC transporter ATP-binding protein [Chlorobiota bacterium]
MITLSLDRIGHRYGHTEVFRNITLSIERGTILGCIGQNGSGKSTLLRIIAGLLFPTFGRVTLTYDKQSSSNPSWLRSKSGYCAPPITLYEELTIAEQLAFHCACRSLPVTSDRIETMLDESGLARYRKTRIGELSSGIGQRLKLLLAFVGNPPLIILDEPSTNLDTAGIETLHTWIVHSASSAIIIIATNISTELAWCTHMFDVERGRFSHVVMSDWARADHE